VASVCVITFAAVSWRCIEKSSLGFEKRILLFPTEAREPMVLAAKLGWAAMRTDDNHPWRHLGEELAVKILG
jgi:hypothetical protein